MTFKPPRRSDKTTARSPADPFTVDGLAAVAEYVRFRPEAVVELSALPQHRRTLEGIARRSGITLPVRELSSAKGGGEAAPVQARVKLTTLDESAFEERSQSRTRDLIIALDHITDPRNLGAIARSAAFFGVRELLAPERRQVLLTQASVATAQGGFALTDLVCVTNLARALEALKERGYWIIGTAMDGEPLAKVAGTYDKTVLVLGNEESGLSQLVRQRCDRVVRIDGSPALGHDVGLESLNVSVAAGILLHAFSGRSHS